MPDGLQFTIPFIPAADDDACQPISGSLVMQVPLETPQRVRLSFDAADGSPHPAGSEPFQGEVANAFCRVRYAPGLQGGLPCVIEFLRSGK